MSNNITQFIIEAAPITLFADLTKKSWYNPHMQKSSKSNINHVWNLEALYSSENDKKLDLDIQEIEKQSYQFINKWSKRDDYLSNPIIMKEALDEYEYWAKNYGHWKPMYYLGLRSSQDQTNSQIKAKINKVEDVVRKVVNDIQFFGLNISRIPVKEQKMFLNEPLLVNYYHFLEKLFAESPHILSDPEEKIMNLKEKTSLDNWIQMVSELLSKEERLVLVDKSKKEKKSFSEILSLCSNPNEDVRKFAARELEGIFLKYLDVVEFEINTVCENQKVNDQIRKYPRPDSRRHINDDMETEVVDTLRSSVTARFDIPQRFYALKAKLLKKKHLNYYERSVVYGDLQKKFSYENSVELVNRTLKRLDNDFSNIFEEFVAKKQLDVFPRKGKRGGAFCTSSGVLSPTYILLNHTDRLNDVLTLAHEVGHGINDELMKKVQNELNYGTPTSTAEVASTFFEDYVLEELLTQCSEEEKLSLLLMKLDGDISTIFRQIAFYNFEYDLHTQFREKGYLPKEEIGKLFHNHMSAYMGKAAVGSENWWVYVEHFRYFFYVYSYASGLLISKALQNMVRKDKSFITNVKEFLSAGESNSPKVIFKNLGIDITDKEFWNRGLSEIDNFLLETEKFAHTIGKL